MRPRGILASFGESSGDPPPVTARQLGNMGSLFVTHPSLIDYTATRAELLETANDLFAMVASGKIKIEINQSYPLREAAAGASRRRGAQDHRLGRPDPLRRSPDS